MVQHHLLTEDTPFGSWLHLAAKHGALTIVQQLLLAGLNPNQRGGVMGGTPINLAALEGHLEIVTHLHQQGAIFETDEPELNPLFSAIQGNHVQVADYLIRSGIDTSVAYSGDNMNETNAVKYAQEWGASEIEELLELKKQKNNNP